MDQQENKMEELKITKEKVLEAASKSSSAKATLETLFPEVFEEEFAAEMGDKFKLNGAKYILAAVDFNKMTLINLASGNRFTDLIIVKKHGKVTKEELNKIMGDNKWNYQKKK